MIGLLLSIALFNGIAFATKKRLTSNQVLHIWAFTIAFQNIFDLFVEFKYHGYWYFGKEVDWEGLLAHTILLPPVNMMFLNWFPFKTNLIKQGTYIVFWEIGLLVYEKGALLPEPWGFFHYGGWKLWHSAIVNPILLLILLGYYQWVQTLEAKLPTER